MRIVRWSAPLLLVLAATPAFAHHSLANYDSSREVALAGEVETFSFTNPHPFLVVAAKGERWKLEMDNLFELADAGLTKDSFRPGDKVTARAWPDRGGARTAYLRRLERASDGLLYEQIGTSPRVTKAPK
jgi:hypothetical protein